MNYNNYIPPELISKQYLPNKYGINHSPLINQQLNGWIPDNQLEIAVPLDSVEEDDLFIIHYYDGFKDLEKAKEICTKLLTNIPEAIKFTILPIRVYLYLFDYPHKVELLDKIGVNNGYMQQSGDKYSIVIFRHRFWPKVLIHELLHILWKCNCYPMPIPGTSPRWDEAIIEANAVTYAIANNFINGKEYNYYLQLSQGKIGSAINCTPEDINIKAGKIMDNSFDEQCLKKQKTNVLEYYFLSSRIRNILNNK